MIKFGAWSVTLLLGSVHGLVMAGLLLRAHANVIANRCLAALLVLVVLLITPYTIGYAGFYDAYPWLTFAPFFWQLGIGPLVYFYVRQLGETRLPRRWGWHFVPLGLQVAYYAALFVLPLDAKSRWDDDVHAPLVLPLQHIATVCSLGVYLLLAAGRLRHYQRWLLDNSAASGEYRLTWLRGFLVATAASVSIAVGFGLVHAWLRPLNYFDEFPLYVAFTLAVYYLGVEGWRNAERAYPPMPAKATDEDSHRLGEHAAASPEPSGPRDWPALGARFSAALVAGVWWREPDLDLAQLARRLGTNTNYLSRALNEGLGVNFSEFINARRIEEAQRRLDEPGEILGIALEVGFRSKASFNRAFRLHAGCTPSEWRNRLTDARRIS